MGSPIKNLLMTAIVFAVLLGLASTVMAVPVDINWVKVNGDEVQTGGNEIRNLDRANEFDIKVSLTAAADAENVQVETIMRGYDHDDLIEDISDVFDVIENVTYVKTLHITLPQRMEDQEQYWLRVIVSDRNTDLVIENYDILVESNRHSVQIKDVILSPSYEVKAGRALLSTVRIKNYGMADEDSLKVDVSMPELGIAASDYIDKLDAGDSITSEELYLRVPMCVEEGNYNVDVMLTYDDGDEVEHVTKTVKVVQDESCNANTEEPTVEEKTYITAPGIQDVTATGAVYPILVTNTGANAKTYTFKVSGINSWGSYTIEPASVVVVPAGSTETAYVYVSAKEGAVAGENAFFVEVSSGTDSEVLPLTANVVVEDDASSAGWDKVKRGLEIGLVILVVLLVILGLIIGFNKLKGNDSDKDDEVTGQTYY